MGEYTMKTRADFLGEDLRTALQWAKLGKIVNSDAKGIKLWSNGYRQHSFVYYGIDEVHIGSAEELQAFFKPIRDHQRKLRQTCLLKQQQEDKKLYDENIRYARQTAANKVASTILSSLATQYYATDPHSAHRGIVIDTETTGLSSKVDEILKLSIIDLGGNILIDTLVRPYYHDSWPEAQRINSISPEMVASAPYPHEILPNVVQIFSECSVCIGYSTYFDLDFLRNWGIDTKFKIIDVMADFANYYTEYVDPYNNGRFCKLTECAGFWNFDWTGRAHDSLADAQATLFCYRKLCETGYYPYSHVEPARMSDQLAAAQQQAAADTLHENRAFDRGDEHFTL